MILKYILDGIIIGFSASVPLGPIGVLCIQRTLNKGRLAGFFSGWVLHLVILCMLLLQDLVCRLLFSFIEQQLLYIQIFGAAILIFLGIKIFYSNPAKQLRKQKRGKGNLFQDFVSTFLITISNPLAIFLFLAFFCKFWSS